MSNDRLTILQTLIHLICEIRERYSVVEISKILETTPLSELLIRKPDYEGAKKEESIKKIGVLVGGRMVRIFVDKYDYKFLEEKELKIMFVPKGIEIPKLDEIE